MSVHDLKTRLADVRGIHNLTMALEGGKIMLRWGAGHMAAVDAAASDAEIETAVRAMSKYPPLNLIPDRTAQDVANLATQTAGAAASISERVKPMADITGGESLGSSIRDMIEGHKRQMAELIEGHKATMQQGFDKQIRAAKAVGYLAEDIDRAGDDLLAMVGQYTNEI